MHPLSDYFRCPDDIAAMLGTAEDLPSDAGYFRFGNAIAYGRQSAGAPSSVPDGTLADATTKVSSNGQVLLPFDLTEVIDNLRGERYPRHAGPIERVATASVPHALYYFLRPALPVSVRRHLQRFTWTGWERIPFPSWPVDATVETLMRETLGQLLRSTGLQQAPFVWFWPDGAPGCVMLTHDIEGASGSAFCANLMDIDDAADIRSAFQVVPDAPWVTNGETRELVAALRGRGFEVNVHDLSHDGHLFRDRDLFLERAADINARGREFGSRGFRSGAMYRRQDWFGDLDFSYDMSVPNVAHLEPQRGGCCTVMPFFIGRLLELPLTTAQDYTVFHVLGDYSTRLWEQQIDLVLAQNGLASFITHPDYLIEPRAQAVYAELLKLLARLRSDRGVWIALPSAIDQWWRNRREMTLTNIDGTWRVEGAGSERARIAFARLSGDRVVYDLAA